MTFRIASLWLQAYLQARSGTFEREPLMLDIVLLALGLGFFVISVGYAYACDRL